MQMTYLSLEESCTEWLLVTQLLQRIRFCPEDRTRYQRSLVSFYDALAPISLFV